jgi:virginiamycin A acetyltransferase
MAKNQRIIMRTLFALLGVPRSLIWFVRTESLVSYLRWRHPHVRFGRGCYVDEESTFEDGVHIYDFARVTSTTIGLNSYVAAKSAVHNCTIGRFCSIGPEVMIGLGIHPTGNMVSTHPSFYSSRNPTVSYRKDLSLEEYKPVIIGNDVWVGARAIILDGVTIGDGAVIGAGAVVTKNVEPYTIMGGVPARLIRRRFTQEQADALITFGWWNRGEDFWKQHADLFADADAFLAMVHKER